jgi:hypothetical protein
MIASRLSSIRAFRAPSRGAVHHTNVMNPLPARLFPQQGSTIARSDASSLPVLLSAAGEGEVQRRIESA